MKIDVLTLFPGMFEGPLTESILARARDSGALEVNFHDLREWGMGNYRQVDDEPYGGGVGMVLRVDVVAKAIDAIAGDDTHRIYLSPKGERLHQEKVESIAKEHTSLLLLCGHYEGIDQRIIDGGWIDEEISIGDYVLTGGELPAMVLIDAVARHLPGVLGKDESAHEESFSVATDRKLEYPHYTRPDEYEGHKVPAVLLSGHHAEIEKWRKEQLT